MNSTRAHLRLLGSALLGISMFATVSCGGADPGTVPGIASAEAERVTVDGAPGLTSTVTVRFDRPTKLKRTDVPLASHFELDVPDLRKGDGATRRVLVRAAAFSEGSDREVVLEVDALVPDETTLRVERSAFRRKESGQLTATVTSDLAPLQALMASGPLAVGDASVLRGDTVLPIAEADRDPVAQRQALSDHLDRRSASAEVRARALQHFDSLPADRIESPKLRAALAGLAGTFAEPAIDNLVGTSSCAGRPVTRIAFEPTPTEGLVAQVTHPRTNSRIISITPEAEGESLERLMAILAHEAIHCDRDASQLEEIVATAIDSYFYILVALSDPQGTRHGSALARDLNVDAIALINSGRLVPESIGILPSPGTRQVLPGTNSPVASFAELIAAAYAGVPERSPTEPLAQAYVDLIAQGAGAPAGDAFDLRYLDELLGRAMDPRLLVAAVALFGLEP